MSYGKQLLVLNPRPIRKNPTLSLKRKAKKLYDKLTSSEITLSTKEINHIESLLDSLLALL